MIGKAFFVSFSLTGWLLFLALSTLIFWFIPFVFALYLGVLVYLPYAPDGESRFLRITGPITSEWIGEKIPSACKSALVASEDTKFYEHNGIDLESIEKSIEHNKKNTYKKSKSSKSIRGGSTITQQIVKNAFLSRDRSYLRKAREISGALILDAIMPKNFQLEWYFNVVEFGPNIYGLQKAAQYYFKKNSSELNPSECIALVAILPSPNKWNATLQKKYMSSFLISRYNTILKRMEIMDLSSKKDLAYAESYLPFQKGSWDKIKISTKSYTAPDVSPEDIELPEDDNSGDDANNNLINPDNDDELTTTESIKSDIETKAEILESPTPIENISEIN